ncbi:MAG: DUF4252 domain-containing protein [Rhodothermales bacterium]|nr:DUF4252 domain-containing protein [Rhodothermales bacterium]
MKRNMLIAGIVSLVMASAASGQTNLRSEPGYVDLEAMESWFGEEPYLFVNVKGALLNLVAEASRFEDPDLADLLHRLKAVQVRGYKSDRSDAKAIRSRASNFARELEKKGWETAVRVRDDDEHVELFMKSDGDVIAGLMIVVAKDDDDETVFVNIVGDIDPAQIGRLGRKFDIDELERDW